MPWNTVARTARKASTTSDIAGTPQTSVKWARPPVWEKFGAGAPAGLQNQLVSARGLVGSIPIFSRQSLEEPSSWRERPSHGYSLLERT